jgi:hypothetical protein
MPRDADLRWFVDQTSLGLGSAMALLRGDVIYPGHRRALPDIPEGCKDPVWMPVVAGLGLVVVSRDRHIKSKQGELEAYLRHGIRAFWIAGDNDLGNWENLRRIAKHWDRMERIVEQRPAGPWFYAVNADGLTAFTVRPAPGRAGDRIPLRRTDRRCRWQVTSCR